MFEQTVWVGRSGKQYKYQVYHLNDKFDAVPANYIFVKEVEPGWFIPIYFGQTSDMSKVRENHPKWQCILQNRATHLCVHKSSRDELRRVAEANNLVLKYKPVCND